MSFKKDLPYNSYFFSSNRDNNSKLHTNLLCTCLIVKKPSTTKTIIGKIIRNITVGKVIHKVQIVLLQHNSLLFAMNAMGRFNKIERIPIKTIARDNLL